jgi:hypothetical protein
MKKIIYTSILMLSFIALIAQAPSKMSYQMVIRDSNNNLLSSTSVGLRVQIISGNVNGTVQFEEVHSLTTNANGLASFAIGNGNLTSGNFANIQLDLDEYFVKVSVDPNGGSNYTIESSSQLLSVPYALHAKTSEDSFSGNFDDLTNKPQLQVVNNALQLSGTGSSVNLEDLSGWVIKSNGDLSADNKKVHIGPSWGAMPSNAVFTVLDTTPTYLWVGGTTFNTGVSGGISFTEGFNSMGSCGFDLLVDGDAFGSTGLFLVGGCPVKNDTIFEASRFGDITFRDQFSIDANDIENNNSKSDFYLNHRNLANTTTTTTNRRKGIGIKNKSDNNYIWNIYTRDNGNLELFYNGTLRGTFNSTNGVYTSSSDRNLKKDIQPLESVLSKLKSLQTYSYQFNWQESTDKSRSLGMMAQDVQKYFPELVLQIDNEDGATFQLDYAGLSVVAISAIKEQNAKIEELEKKLAQLELLIEKMNSK